MGRKRSVHHDLPPRVRQKGRALYYVGNDGKWIALGSDRREALEKYARLEGASDGRLIANLIDTYWLRYLPTQTTKLADNTVRNYERYSRTLKALFGEVPCEDLQRAQLQQFYDFHPKKAEARNTVGFIKMLLEMAEGWDWVERNVAEHVKTGTIVGRDVEINEEHREKLRATLAPAARIAIDIGFIVATRISEVADMEIADWKLDEGVVYVKRRKSKDKLPVEITPELQELYKEALALPRKVRTMKYLLVNVHGQRYSEHAIGDAFREACKKLGFYDPPSKAHPKGRYRYWYHDLRRTSARADKSSATKRLGHASESTTKKFYTGKVKDVVTPLRPKKASPIR
jgi:integrase